MTVAPYGGAVVVLQLEVVVVVEAFSLDAEEGTGAPVGPGVPIGAPEPVGDGVGVLKPAPPEQVPASTRFCSQAPASNSL